MDRELTLKESASARLTWHKQLEYTPPLYSFLTDEEWRIFDQWYLDTEEKKMFGECGIPLLSIIQAFIMGNTITNILQLGHYAGYSTLLLGFMMKKMNKKTAFITVDIDEFCCIYTQDWVNRANLQDYVTVLHGSSTDDGILNKVREIFHQNIELIFIDSSHQYCQTVKELDTWYQELSRGGFILLHDSSILSASYDSRNEGGVIRAIEEWHEKNPQVRMININADVGKKETAIPPTTKHKDNIYKDPCGLCIIQK